MKKINKSKLNPNKIITLIIVLIFLFIWEKTVKSGLADPFFFSSPSMILSDFIKTIKDASILPHIKVTLYEALSGIIYGSFFGILLAFLLGSFTKVGEILDPIMISLYSIPKMTLAPLFIVWMGIGIKSKVFLATVEVFFLVFFNTYAGLKNVDKDLVNTVKLMGGNKYDIASKVILPYTVPWILTGVRLSFAVALVGSLVGEYIASTEGLGWMIKRSSDTFDITRIMTCILILMIIIQILNKILKLLENKILKWHPNNN